jgi:hypothetical protein
VIQISGRTGLGQDFELEFGGLWPAAASSIRVTETAKYRTGKFFPGATGSETHLVWDDLGGERRLMISVAGLKPIPFDSASDPIQQALLRWVEKFATQVRIGRQE